MKFYNQSDLFWTLISAAGNAQLMPDAAMLQRYKEKRLQRAIKALRSKNIFLYTEGTRPSVNLNDLTTIYTQPAGVRLLVVGYSDNFRYGAIEAQDAAPAQVQLVFPQTHRVRVVGGEAKALSDDFVMAQSGASGQPRYTSDRLPVPFILEPDQQIAVDLGYDTAMAAPTQIPAQAFTFFCIRVKSQLSPEDYVAIDEIKDYIANHNFQRGVFLNCANADNLAGVLSGNTVVFSNAIAGGTATCFTRPANGPILINGIATTLAASRLSISDTADNHSFSLNRLMRSTAINFPEASRFVPVTTNVQGVPTSAPVWCAYWELPIPHLLRPGAQLKAEIINGGTDAQGIARVDNQGANVLMFQGATV